jgi:ribonuclease MRP protein subunit RMP1
MAPKIPQPETEIKRARTAIEELNDLSHLTYLLYRRNKNQHRRSHWWRHFNIFRRQLNKLCLELESVKQPEDRNKDTPLELNAKADARVDVWVHLYIAKWYASFSQILAEKRFAALGVAVFALFARVCGLTGATAKLSEEGEVELSATLAHAEAARPMLTFQEDDDIGEAIERPILHIAEDLATTPSRKTKPPKDKKKAKKVSKGGAIDDIFGALE